jgi:hypothetical protein
VLVARFHNRATLGPNPNGRLGHIPVRRICTDLLETAQARARAGDAVVMLRVGRGD